jgi:ketosteroid isomerase-like protein
MLMRQLAILAFVALVGTSAGANQPQRGGEEQIVALERARQEAFVRGDIDFLDRQTADDYTTVNGAGAMSTKPEMMKSLRAGTTKVTSFELDELRARLYGDVAVLTGIYRDQSSVNGRDRRVNVRFIRVFVKEDGRWRAVSYQQTPLATP